MVIVTCSHSAVARTCIAMLFPLGRPDHGTVASRTAGNIWNGPAGRTQGFYEAYFRPPKLRVAGTFLAMFRFFSKKASVPITKESTLPFVRD